MRSIADFFLFAAYTMIDGLAVTLTSNYDALYGGLAKVASLAAPMIIFPALCGFLVDYYSELAGHADYAPPFVIADGLLLITAVLVMAVPATPLPQLGAPVASAQSTASLRSTPSLRALKAQGGQGARRRLTARSCWLLTLLVLPLALVAGAQWGLLQTALYPFYVQLAASKLWLGLGCAAAFATLAPFAYLSKPLVSGLGRAHLVVLGFVFYTLRLSGISFLSHQPRWTLLPFEAMEAFTLPIAWIGLTSYAHSLIAAGAPRAETMMTRSGALHPSTTAHLVLQYALNIVHFGLGRPLGAGLWIVWLRHWDDSLRIWDWLNKNDMDLPEMDANGFRILLRLMALASASIALPFLFFYHIFGRLLALCMMCLRGLQRFGVSCKNCFTSACNSLCCCSCKFSMCECMRVCKRRRKKPSPRPSTECVGEIAANHNSNGHGHPGTVLNGGGSYSRLVDHSGADGRFYHTSCKELDAANHVTRTPIEMQPKRNFSASPRLIPNGSNRIKMSDVVGDDESLLSTR